MQTVRYGDNIFLKRSLDRIKDQSYMLYRLDKDILARCIFPLGNSLKKILFRKQLLKDFLFKVSKRVRIYVLLKVNTLNLSKRTVI